MRLFGKVLSLLNLRINRHEVMGSIGDSWTGFVYLAGMGGLLVISGGVLSTIVMAVLFVPLFLVSSFFGVDISWLNVLWDDSWLGVDWVWVMIYLPWVILFVFMGCGEIKRKYGWRTLRPF